MLSPLLLSLLRAAALILFAATPAVAGPVHVFGPGGPLPAMRAAAEAFSARRGVPVEVKAGPTPEWLDEAKASGDLIFSGAENMMTDFVAAMDGRIDSADAVPLYLRPSAILVRPGNPKDIKGLEDLFQPGHRVLVVQGAGQTGLWEDMAGRTGEIAKVRALSANIATVAANSAKAKAAWTDDPTLDAWIIWTHWQIANPTLADLVEVEEPYRIYRDAGAVLTTRGKANPDAAAFLDYLRSPEGAAHFAAQGWITAD